MISITEGKPTKISGKSSLYITFTYNPKVVQLIKSCSSFNYDAKTYTWELPVSVLSYLLDSLTYLDDIKLKLLGEEKDLADNVKLVVNYKTKPFSYQMDAIKYGLSHEKWLLLDAPGLGKAVTLDTKVLTPSGYIEMRYIKVGDNVFSDDGDICKVTNIYNHELLNMYKITFSDNTSVTCCEDHLWQLQYECNEWNKEEKCYYRIKHNDCHDTKWLLDKNRYLKQQIRIPRCHPLKFPKTDLPLHPYVLGCLLGDGSITHSATMTSADQFIIDKLNALLPDDYRCYPTGYSYGYRITNDAGKNKHITSSGNKINNILKDLNLYGKNSHTKFIPDCYKYASIEDRLALIQGLMDTDGYAQKDNLLQYNTVNKQLAEDIKFLVQSFGATVNMKEGRSAYKDKHGNKKDCGISYTLTIRYDTPQDFVSLPRKVARLHNRKFLPRRIIKKIDYVGKLPGKCITVDSPNHLYIIDNCIVTHNTLQTICLAEELKAQKGIEHCLIVCGLNSLKTNWKSEIEKHSNLKCRILGERINKKGNVSYASVADRAKELEEPIEEFFIITNIESFGEEKIPMFNRDGSPKLNAKGKQMYKAVCPLVEAFKKSKNKIDMIAIDEVHKCKDPTAQRTSNFIKLDSEFKLAMTGTLLLNNPLDAYVALHWTGNDASTYTNFKSMYCEFGGFGGHEIIGYKNLNILKDELENCSLRRTKETLKLEGKELPPRTFVNEYVDMDKAHKDFYEAIKAGVKEEADLIDLKANNLLALVTRLRQATACPQLLTSKGVMSSKVERAIDLVEEIVSQGEKVVVFSTFKEPVEQLAKALAKYKPLVATGDTKDAEVEQIKAAFMTDKARKVLLGTWQKMGTGHTLTSACYMIFIDTPWTYSVYLQACDRIHRIGQTKPVTVYNLMCVNTIDERVQDILETKKALSEFVIDDKIESETDMEALRKIISDL